MISRLKLPVVAVCILALLASAIAPSAGQDAQPVADPSPQPVGQDQYASQGKMELAPIQKGDDPADYGSDARGYYWQDSVALTGIYGVELGRGVTTHGHGVAVVASHAIYVNGTIDVDGHGVAGEAGYDLSNRAQVLAIQTGYGLLDASGSDYLLYGGTPTCDQPGGGYVILRAPIIVIQGTITAKGVGCGPAGVVILEGSAQVTGTIAAGLVIQRGF